MEIKVNINENSHNYNHIAFENFLGKALNKIYPEYDFDIDVKAARLSAVTALPADEDPVFEDEIYDIEDDIKLRVDLLCEQFNDR